VILVIVAIVMCFMLPSPAQVVLAAVVALLALRQRVARQNFDNLVGAVAQLHARAAQDDLGKPMPPVEL